jgi:hypothetical protein
MEVHMFGFPDGYITDYERAVAAPLTVLAWTEAGLGLLFVTLAVVPIGARLRLIAAAITALAFVLLAVAAEMWLPWYFGIHLGLDNGIGG